MPVAVVVCGGQNRRRDHRRRQPGRHKKSKPPVCNGPLVYRKLKLLITGTGGCASGAYAVYLTSAGVPCGHEAVFGAQGYSQTVARLRAPDCKYAEASWLAAPYIDDQILDEALVVHLVRHYSLVLESSMSITSNKGRWGGRYFMYSVPWCPRLLEFGRSWTGCAYRWVEWNKLIERKVREAGREYVRFDVANSPFELLEELKQRGLSLEIDHDAPIYQRRDINSHRKMMSQKFKFSRDKIEDERVLADLEELAGEYGFDEK